MSNVRDSTRRGKHKDFGIPGIMGKRRKELVLALKDEGELPDDDRGRKIAQVMAHTIVAQCSPNPARAFLLWCDEWADWMDGGEIDSIFQYALDKPRKFT